MELLLVRNERHLYYLVYLLHSNECVCCVSVYVVCRLQYDEGNRETVFLLSGHDQRIHLYKEVGCVRVFPCLLAYNGHECLCVMSWIFILICRITFPSDGLINLSLSRSLGLAERFTASVWGTASGAFLPRADGSAQQVSICFISSFTSSTLWVFISARLRCDVMVISDDFSPVQADVVSCKGKYFWLVLQAGFINFCLLIQRIL